MWQRLWRHCLTELKYRRLSGCLELRQIGWLPPHWFPAPIIPQNCNNVCAGHCSHKYNGQHCMPHSMSQHRHVCGICHICHALLPIFAKLAIARCSPAAGIARMQNYTVARMCPCCPTIKSWVGQIWSGFCSQSWDYHNDVVTQASSANIRALLCPLQSRDPFKLMCRALRTI